MKTCTTCQVEQPLDNFYAQSGGRGHQGQCKACLAKKRIPYRQDTREQRSLYNREYYLRHREEALERAKRWRENNPDRFRELSRKSMTVRRAKIRQQILDAYGGKCACCSESIPDFLALDHIDGDGKKHRTSLKSVSSYQVYLDVIRQGCPPSFRLLCHNCNMAIYMNKGTCPHKTAQQLTDGK